jgi:Surface adhesin CshA non-repetitive domain 2
MWMMAKIRQLCWRLLGFAVLWVGLSATPAYAQSCAPATTQGTAPAGWETYCWLDFATYNDATARSASGQNFAIPLTDGSTLNFNLKVTPTTATAFSSVVAPSWTGAAVGNTAFLGIPGRPILYTASAGAKSITFSSISITPPPGAPAVTVYSFVAADAESTNNGENLQFITNGSGWTILDQVDPISGSAYPTISGTGTNTFTETGVAGTVGGYIVGSNSPTTVTANMQAGGLQGAMFAVRFASMRLRKVIGGARVDPTDQFNFRASATSSGTTLASGATTGTGNGPFSATPLSLASGLAITLSESMAAGSASAIAKYDSRLSCINGTASSTTPLPSNVQTTSYNFGALQFGDAIICTYTNTAYPHLRLQKALGAGGRQFAADQFVMNINQGASTVATTTTTGTGATITTGATAQTQVTAGTAYAMTEAASGTTSLSQYTATMSCTNAATSSTALPTTVGGVITPQMGDIVTCTITNTKKASNATLLINKTSVTTADSVSAANPKSIPGAIVQYSLRVQNTGPSAVDNNTVFLVDALPGTLSVGSAAAPALVQGTPTSNLSFSAATDIRYSNQTTAPTSFAACSAAPHNYTPVSAYDPAVRYICINPKGIMSGSSGTPPSFTITFNAQVN